MATAAAVLNILVSADTAQASASLTKYDRQLAAVNEQSRKGIEARLGANYDPAAFNRYEEALKKASSRASNRAAFKAELGANYNNTAFNQYQRATEKASTSTKEAAKHTDSLSRSVGGLAKSLLAAGGAFAAYEAAKEAITSTLELGHATERLSAVTGLDVKQASTWIETLKVRGVATKAVGMAFITLSRNVRTAQDADTAHINKISQLVESQKKEREALEATGASHKQLTLLAERQSAALDKLSGPSTSKAVAAFAELGVSQDTLKSKNTDRILLAVADGMAKVEDPTRRAALAQQIFGRGAQGLIPILAQGKQGVEDALAATQRYGAYLPQNAKQLKGAVDAQHNLNLAMDGMKISFTQAVLPALVQGANGLVKFIGQMRSGSGAGGQFASAIKDSFGTVKTVVTNVIDAVGGLGNAVKIAVGAFAAIKITEFGLALKGVFDTIRGSPVGAFFTVVGLLAGAFLALSGHQETAAQTARQVAEAWNEARHAANELAQASLGVVQAHLNVTAANQAVTAAQKDVTKAADEYGKKSPQYKQAEDNLKQAKLSSKQASLDLKDAEQTEHDAKDKNREATDKATAASKNQVSQDKERIKTLNTQILALGHQGGQLSQIHDKEGQLSQATQQLTADTAALNKAINATPAVTLANIDLNVDFQSNMAGAIEAIAKSIGGTPLSKTPSFANPKHHFTGGMVTQPGYFAGEEAPQHPEIILATNPAYRQRNLGLFAQAGNMLGIPGFAAGGITPNTSKEVSGAPPWMAKAAAAWMKPEANSWVQNIADQLKQTLGGGSAGGNSQLAGLWVSAGGPAAVALIAAAIAMAESGGRNIVQQGQPYGSTGWGLWQITPGNSEPQFGIDQALLIPINNARAAVDKYHNAPHGGNNFSPWTTYVSGAYKQFLSSLATGGIGAPTGAVGTVSDPSGKPVAAWIEPILQWARGHGWAGSVTSGWRSDAEQKRIYDSGVRPAAVPISEGGSGSNHEFTQYPGGAVDVSGAAQLSSVLSRSPYASTLIWAGSKDPVHFSHPHGGSYARGGVHGRVRRYAKGGMFNRARGYASGGVHYPHWPSGRANWDKHHGYTWWVNYAMKHGLSHPGVGMGSGQFYSSLYDYFRVQGQDSSKIPHEAWFNWHPNWDRGLTGYRQGGVHGRAGFQNGGFTQPKYENKLQQRFSKATQILHNLWGVAAPYYHRSAASQMPPVTYTQGNDGLFVGVAAGGGPGHRQFFLPDWVVTGKHGLQNLDPSMLALMIHEWTHMFQRNDVINKVKAPKNIIVAEGGAQALAQRATPAILGRMGVPFSMSQIIDPKNAPYYPYTQWVEKNLGPNWIFNKQFGYRKGGIRGRGGIPGYQGGGVHGASFTQTGTATGMSGFRGLTGVPKPSTQTVPSRFIPTAPPSALGAITNMPALPTIRGGIPNTAAGAGQIQGSISSLRSQIAGLEQQYSTLDQYYSLNTDVFVDPNTGELNQPAIDKRVAELDQLISLRQKIFDKWQRVIVLTQRLVASNRAIIARFQKALAGISTKGLKGNALKSAQQHQSDAKTAIAKYQGNLTTALSDLTSAGSDRDNAWLSLLTTQNERAGVAGTQAQPAVAAGDTGAAGAAAVGPGSDTANALLQQIATTATQTLAVSQAQYAALQQTPPFGGSFADGGVVPGPAGAPRVIVAHGGEMVGAAPAVHIHFASGMEWLREFVSIEVQNNTRGQSVGAMRIAGLPGSRGGL